jgi:capsular exopolysaccharide family
VTSHNPGEGKTSLAIGLSVAMANSGWRVLLIDADMRKPVAAKRLSEDTQPGLSDYLTGRIDLKDIIRETNITNFYFVSCGSDILNPIGLLSSARFEEIMQKLHEAYDFVLFDTPALASVVDGAMVASKVDASLLIVKMGSTKLPDLKRAKEQLQNFNSCILGVVLNKVKKRDYKLHYGSYDYFFKSERFFKNKKAGHIKLSNRVK